MNTKKLKPKKNDLPSKTIQNQKVKKSIETSQNKKWMSFVFAIVLAVVCYMAYLPSIKNEFTNWDDEKYVVENQVIRSLETQNIKAMFSSYFVGNYQPLTILSYSIDYTLSETYPTLSPTVFHITNNILHLLNTVLVFWFILLIFKKIKINNIEISEPYASISAFVSALIFGIHPLHVESVAWIAERKDVLYAFFFFASLISYIYYVQKNQIVLLIVSILMFLLSLLSKGQAVSLAVTLVAIDFLLQRKLLSLKVIAEKIPYFVLALVFGIVAIMAQKQAGAVNDGLVHTFAQKTAFAAYGFSQYWFKLLAPLHLSALYTYPSLESGSLPIKYWLHLIPAILILGTTVFTTLKSRVLSFSFLFFIVNIFLVLQFFQVGGAVMADRYSYVPSLGFSFIVGIGMVYMFLKNRQLGYILLFALFAYTIFLYQITHQRIGVWQNSLTLWDDVLSKYTNSSEAWVNRATHKYKKIKDYNGALYDYNKALEINPNLPEAVAGRGVIKRNLGDLQGAMADYNRAIELKPNDAEVYSNRGVCKAGMNDLNGAIADFTISLQLVPNNFMTYSNLGSAYFKSRDFENAIKNYNKALELNPTYAEAYSNRGGVKTELGNYEEAIKDFDKAIYYNPNYSSAYFNKGMLYQRTEKHTLAIESFSKAIEFENKNPQVFFVRGVSYLAIEKKNEACADFAVAAKLNFAPAIEKMNSVCK